MSIFLQLEFRAFDFSGQVVEAHKGGVTAVCACSDRSVASVGHDGFLLVHAG